MSEGPPDDRDAGNKAKNRAALLWILAACVVMGTLGFLFALWLRGRPGP